MTATEGLEIEAAQDVSRAASRYREGGARFSDLMIACAAQRRRATPLYTFDRKLAALEGTVLLNAPKAEPH